MILSRHAHTESISTRRREVDLTQRGSLRREGDFWRMTWGDRVSFVRHSIGMTQIVQLLRQPGISVSALTLSRLDHAACRVDPGLDRGLTIRAESDAGIVLDARARAAYRARFLELETLLQHADDLSVAQKAKLQRELGCLARELERATGLRGRPRRALSAAERARVNVTRTLRTAVRSIDRQDSVAGDHFAASISTGCVCCYDPACHGDVDWTL